MLSRLPARCPACKVKFTAEEKGLRLHPTCVDAWLEIVRAKQRAKQQREQRAKVKVERATDRKKKQAMKRLSELKAEAQPYFNKFIRLRDADKPCVSCGETNPPMKPGGQWDAGHFLSRGARPELAFEEDNCHRQCKSCNAGGGKYAHKERTVNEKYEEELIRRIGADRVAWLKGPHPPKHWSREELEALKAHYARKCREMEKEHDHLHD